MKSPQLILASRSVGRKELLEQLGVAFEVKISTIDEQSITDSNHFVTIQKRSHAKANDVANRHSGKSASWRTHPESRSWTHFDYSAQGQDDLSSTPSLILAADSGAILDSELFGKPKNKEDAFRIITRLSGRTHILATAMTVMEINGKTIKTVHDSITQTAVTFKNTTEPERRAYTNRYDLTRFAGAYALNVTPWDLITKIEGSYTNVIGLPFEKLLPVLTSFRVI